MAPIPEPRLWLILSLLLTICGCGESGNGPNREGPAAEAGIAYCNLLFAGDWKGARALVHSQAKITPSGFEQKARALVKRWNLEGPEVRVTSLGEKDGATVAHLAMRGKRNGKSVRVTESLILKLDGTEWKVMPAS